MDRKRELDSRSAADDDDDTARSLSDTRAKGLETAQKGVDRLYRDCVFGGAGDAFGIRRLSDVEGHNVVGQRRPIATGHVLRSQIDAHGFRPEKGRSRGGRERERVDVGVLFPVQASDHARQHA